MEHFFCFGKKDFCDSELCSPNCEFCDDSGGLEWNQLEIVFESIFGEGYDLSRLRELAQADRDGRCVVLSEPMSPMVQIPGDTDVYCPNCAQNLSGGWPLSDAGDYRKMCQCPNCGQSIDDTICEFSEEALRRKRNE